MVPKACKNEGQEENPDKEVFSFETFNKKAGRPKGSKNGGAKYFFCPHCDYEYQGMIKLERHINNHTGNKPLACDQCSHKAQTRHELNRHKKYKHTQLRNYKCDDCGKGFVENSHLKRHKLVHTGERTWQCSECPLVFQSKFHLKRHARIHTGEKPYICPSCDQGFQQQQDMKAHMQKHLIKQKQRRFPCNFCESGYDRLYDLKSHTRRDHLEANSTQCEDWKMNTL